MGRGGDGSGPWVVAVPFLCEGGGGDKRQEEGAFLLIHNPGEREWGRKENSGRSQKECDFPTKQSDQKYFFELIHGYI